MSLLDLTLLRRDGGTQPRDHIDLDVAREYAEALADGAELPPVTAFYDGTDYWLADGFHRVTAHELLERATIDVDVHQGDRRDAVLFSVGANADHGYRRTNLDKRRAVVALLNDEEWSRWSDREIGRRCHVSKDLVASLRPKPANTGGSDSEPTRVFLDRYGNKGEMKVGAIGKRPSEASEGSAAERAVDAPALQPMQGAGSRQLHDAPEVNGEYAHIIIAATEPSAAPQAAASPDQPTVAAPAEPVCARTGAPLLLAMLDTLEQVQAWPTPAALLELWRRDIGKGPEPDQIKFVAAWFAEFASGFPIVHALRRAAITTMLEGIQSDVVE